MKVAGVLRGLMLALFLAACGDGTASTETAGKTDGWKDWEVFANRFMQADGRIIDITFDQKSTSEGQSYGLFFALVANDRARFDRILEWTSANLAGKHLGERLPAWHWGKRGDGNWGVIDENAASDADLWIAYALMEAERLWNAPAYGETGRALLKQVKSREIVRAGDAGMVLLPGPYGFELEGGRFRIDPSYLPPFQFRYFATVDPDGPWKDVLDAHMKMVVQPYSRGIVPDLFIVDKRGKTYPDTDRPHGGYDGIRVYMWAAMSGKDGESLMHMLKPFAKITRDLGAPPEKIDSFTGQVLSNGYSPPGFSGALLPFLKVLDEEQALKQQLQLLPKRLDKPTNYYDECLILFGKGWLDGQYRFDEQGKLVPRWRN